MKQITVTAQELNNDEGNGGLEVIIPGAEGNPEEEFDCPLFVEYYKGKLRVVIWDGSSEPQIIPIKHFKPKNVESDKEPQIALPSSANELIDAVHSDSKRWNELVRENPLWKAVLISAFEKITNGHFNHQGVTMTCKNCNSKRIASVCSKASDGHSITIGDKEHNGYMPDDLNLGDDSDYVEFDYCLDCGMIQADFPLPLTKLETSSKEPQTKRTINILQHEIEYWFHNDDLYPDGICLNGVDIEHIGKRIHEGYSWGELCSSNGDNEERGYWEIIR
jgi:hypothetical protein